MNVHLGKTANQVFVLRDSHWYERDISDPGFDEDNFVISEEGTKYVLPPKLYNLKFINSLAMLLWLF